MAKSSELTIALKAENKELTRKLAQAERQLDKFKAKAKASKGSLDLSSMVSGLAKFAPQLTAATLAYEGFNQVLSHNQTLGDAFNNTITGIKEGIGNWIGSITTATSELSDFIAKAREAAEALDTLGNTNLSLDFMTSRIGSKINEKFLTASDKSLGTEERKAALNMAESYISELQSALNLKLSDVNKVLNAQIGSVFANVDFNFDNGIYAEMIEASARVDRDEIKKQAALTAKQYDNLQEDIRHQLHKSGSAKVGSQTFNSYDEAWTYANSLLSDEQKKNLALYAMFQSFSDERLKEFQSLLQDSYKTEDTINAYTKRIIKLQNTLNESNVVKPQQAPTLHIVEDKEELQDELEIIDTVIPNSIRALQESMAKLKESMSNIDIDSDRFKTLLAEYDELAKKLDLIRNKNKEVEVAQMDYASILNASAQAVGTLTQSISSLDEDNKSLVATMGALQGVMTAAAAATQLMNAASAIQKGISTSTNWVEAIAAVASLTSAVIGSFVAMKNAARFESGGIVGGQSFSGDNIGVRVNSGEMILTRGQQSKLFSMINTGANNNNSGQVEFVISGENLTGVLSNINRKRGRI